MILILKKDDGWWVTVFILGFKVSSAKVSFVWMEILIFLVFFVPLKFFSSVSFFCAGQLPLVFATNEWCLVQRGAAESYVCMCVSCMCERERAWWGEGRGLWGCDFCNGGESRVEWRREWREPKRKRNERRRRKKRTRAHTHASKTPGLYKGIGCSQPCAAPCSEDADAVHLFDLRGVRGRRRWPGGWRRGAAGICLLQT